MRLAINFYKASQDYRKYVDYVEKAMRLTKDEVKEKLSLEAFAIWLEGEFPRFVEARAK